MVVPTCYCSVLFFLIEREHRFLLEIKERMKNHRKNLVPLFGLFLCERKCEIGSFEINLVSLTSVTLVTSHIS